ncbi:DEAD-domain-containing protein [Phellopilus nigrolimitatus]|nr:DEAD-domain-containing protein [Phellopilus nigrolimitatus]
MAPMKRKHLAEESDAEDFTQGSSHNAISDDEVDIFTALAGKKKLENMIKESVTKRDKKEGTKLLKNTKGKTKMSKGEVGGGSFQSMGLHPSLLRSLTLRGYKVPTPIQRLTIPTLLASPPRDLVGMARTGSGKTLAYMVPLVQRLGGRHASMFGATVGKELARGWSAVEGGHAGDNEDDEVVGGEGLDEQFEMITSNPDVIIATPGRLLHLIVEMNLDLRSVQYVVFDEADRLFEMGFSTALNEILHRLPSSRQTLLFSATLPKSLVEFAKAGLQDPKLVRLDAESKISSDLRMAFFSVKQAEKDACLLILLRDSSKGKGKDSQHAAPHQTLVFTATKHHVEYVSNLLSTAGYAVSHIYGALDQVARGAQMENFRRGRTNILVVTDVAARGIDIPVLAHVVNFDFPAGARVFVHRVGRTARAGRTGWAWSFVTATELPHMLDFQLFLGRPMRSTAEGSAGELPYVESLVLGAFPRAKLDEEGEYVHGLHEENRALTLMRDVMRRGQQMYERSQGKASQASYKRAKEMMRAGRWGFATTVGEMTIHPVFRLMQGTSGDEQAEKEEEARNALLKAVNGFSPVETVFEIGNRGKSTSAALMKDRRKALQKARERAVPSASIIEEERQEENVAVPSMEVEMADEDDIEAVFASSSKHGRYRDSEFYMSHIQKGAMTEKGCVPLTFIPCRNNINGFEFRYSLRDGASFAEQASGATFELAGDEGVASRQRRNGQLKWDKKKKKFIKGDGEGADNMKIVKTEGGTRLPATYRSGRYDEWKAKTHTHVPRVGEAEPENTKRRMGGTGPGGKRFKHQAVTPAKPLDKRNNDYERKTRQLEKKREAGGAEPPANASHPKRGMMGAKRGGSRYGGKPIGRVKSELKSADQIRRTREVAERKREKNARPSRGRKR